MARKAASKYGGGEDLERAALQGLVKALSFYKPEEGQKFSTYATRFMKKEVEKVAKRQSKAS